MITNMVMCLQCYRLYVGDTCPGCGAAENIPVELEGD